MQPKQKTNLTPDEYLAIERKADIKSEYYNGEMFALAGASEKHELICGNTFAAIHQLVEEKPCKVYSSNMRIWIEKSGLYTYPDISIVCGKTEFVDSKVDTLKNPVTVTEVLSDSTEKYDRSQKFKFYMSIPTLKEYILISQNKIILEQFIKDEKKDNEWILRIYDKLEDSFEIYSIKEKINLKDIYDKIEFEPNERLNR
ncbi:MAG: Uma2 family endonuclease [Bacteroidota bacterium]|nr:Uma2 family endonuclease [Bacteroidota bacterium]